MKRISAAKHQCGKSHEPDSTAALPLLQQPDTGADSEDQIEEIKD